jgi:excisionase family DNA binding protein
MNKLLKKSEVCNILDIHNSTLENLMRSGDIKYIKLNQGKGTVRFQLKDVEQLITEKKI